MDEIICQQCGHTNPMDAVFCQRCGALLPPSRPATDQLAPTLRAGEEPQKKSTSELEPLLPAWLREMRKGEESPPAPKEEKSAPPPPPSSQPSVAPEAEEEEIPEWLKELGILSSGPRKAQSVSFSEKEGKEEESAAPQEGWSKDLGPLSAPGSVANAFETGPSAGAEPEAEASSMLFSADELPAWLRGEAQSAAPTAEEPVPDWLKAFAEEPPAPATPAEPAAPPAEEPVPDWLKAFAEEPPAPTAPAEPAAPAAEEPVPDWLKAFAEEPPAPTAPAQPAVPAAEEPAPDWLKAFAEETPGTTQASQPPSTPAVIGTSGAGEEDLSSPLEMEIPDWLAGISAEATSSQPAAEETPALEAAELPAWVQAMRPIEAILSSEVEGAASLEEEKEGPLAGLRGVLPRAPETLPYIRPRTYSVRLNVTQDHQAHVQLLEQLIAAESQPRPRQATPAQKSGLFGYWLIAILLLAAILLPLFGGTQMTAMPALIPRGTWQFIESFNALPASPTILLVLDYEMSTSGEMEALLLPPLRHLTSIKQAHLAFIALNPLMSTMDERLLEALHVAQPQMPLPESVNLGYLPGGLSALPLFASNPTFAASPEARARWERSPFQRVKTLRDFDCVVLVTDNAESARLWIEQTSSPKYTLLMVSSARSAPMLSPYFYSGQAKGMIAGLNDAAAYEQMSGLSGLARRYRDAYSAGLLLALGAGGIGALWGLLIRRNSKPQEGA